MVSYVAVEGLKVLLQVFVTGKNVYLIHIILPNRVTMCRLAVRKPGHNMLAYSVFTPPLPLGSGLAAASSRASQTLIWLAPRWAQA